MEINSITWRELAALFEEGKPIDLVDVRMPVEYRQMHAPHARNVPLNELDPQALIEARDGSAEAPLYVICHSGSRGRQACERFLRAGFRNVFNVEGGMLAWAAAGLPVVRGKAAISLERQVRIAAGSLVVVGTVLGWLVHPAFTALAAFVGAGLVFAGITDTCGMGLLLARMPWNRVETGVACDLPELNQPQAGCDA
jgi:rhodanese-related sulfurtransferase